MVPGQNESHELAELFLHGLFRVVSFSFCSSLRLFVKVVLPDQGREPTDVVIRPHGFALQQVVDLSLRGRTLQYSFLIRNLGFASGLTSLVDSVLYANA